MKTLSRLLALVATTIFSALSLGLIFCFTAFSLLATGLLLLWRKFFPAQEQQAVFEVKPNRVWYDT
ncbi:hypothetical protein A4G20_09355 [Pasteurellaceae bacterium RH1A]|nr:hypothetical protein A4G20_09355 [Pasteurellaceae bacterium RH1A]